ncbi:uncharacterized protein BCR38DRAFT_27008 [Pseudomassariella vexata]|uniref:Uncharacterized protein n=1 Tax=Pseudomassariella vexata TaxID=1141098 RepID=A0A1Y2EKM7_9PEZI|nr:uncharacterized protein BCR38DRAFT_27008 [Pseudomassariella vexata]ORY72091.1 hypothetical protein BCR38DRAFT_27008 [Pseudomassariella vexata]
MPITGVSDRKLKTVCRTLEEAAEEGKALVNMKDITQYLKDCAIDPETIEEMTHEQVGQVMECLKPNQRENERGPDKQAPRIRESEHPMTAHESRNLDADLTEDSAYMSNMSISEPGDDNSETFPVRLISPSYIGNIERVIGKLSLSQETSIFDPTDLEMDHLEHGSEIKLQWSTDGPPLGKKNGNTRFLVKTIDRRGPNMIFGRGYDDLILGNQVTESEDAMPSRGKYVPKVGPSARQIDEEEEEDKEERNDYVVDMIHRSYEQEKARRKRRRGEGIPDDDPQSKRARMRPMER